MGRYMEGRCLPQALELELDGVGIRMTCELVNGFCLLTTTHYLEEHCNPGETETAWAFKLRQH